MPAAAPKVARGTNKLRSKAPAQRLLGNCTTHARIRCLWYPADTLRPVNLAPWYMAKALDQRAPLAGFDLVHEKVAASSRSIDS